MFNQFKQVVDAKQTNYWVKGFYESKRIFELEFDNMESIELFISRIKTQRFTSIYNPNLGEFGRYFMQSLDFEIDPREDKVTYFIKFSKYNV